LPYRLLLDKLKTVVRKSPLLERSVRRLLDRRYQMARKHLSGIGIEIGALDRPLTLPCQAKAYYLDRLFPAQLRVHYPELSHKRFHVSIVGDGEQLAFIRNEALDFLVANHLIEHCEDPIATLETFAKKLRPGGVVFMAVPDMRRTFDRNRDETTWEHLFDDHTQGPQKSRLQHYREWSSKVKGFTGEAAERLAAQLSDAKYSIHFHCWTQKGFADFLERMCLIAPVSLLEMRSWKNENIFILTKDESIGHRLDIHRQGAM
jgi:SAM-dependent methyltransferase